MSAPRVQIAVDCEQPHELVKFWAEAMHYAVEEQDAVVRTALASGMAQPEDTVELADGTLAWRTATACIDPAGVGPRLLFQWVPERKTVKNRVHLDLHPDGDRAAEVQRLLALGATKLWDGAEGPFTWVTMADPEGNEFCVA